MKQKAVLLFADCLGLDLARRRLPQCLRPLFDTSGFADFQHEADVHIFSSVQAHISAQPNAHLQHGRSFAEKLENAVAMIAALGYGEIVIVGRDCPQLNQTDIATAFDALTEQRLVLGPDHRGGCYLIALRSVDRELLHGIRWRQNTDFAQLRDRCEAAEVFLLPVKQDLDSWADVGLLARSGDRFGKIAAFILVLVSGFARSADFFVDLAAARVRVRGQMPPPALVG